MAAWSALTPSGSSPFDHVRRATEELRAAVREYEAAIAADPGVPEHHYELVQALAMLGQAHDAIARYRGRDDLISLRCLAQAYVADGRWPDAEATIARAPDDRFMLEQLAEMRSRTGREEEALAIWARALAVDSESIAGHYHRAFLLERLGRTAEAIAEWQAIVEWSQARGGDEDAEWPRQEIARLRGEAAPQARRAVRLLTIADLGDDVDRRQIAVSARHEAVLDDGSRVLLLGDRGWTEGIRGPGADEIEELWVVTPESHIAETARVVVGPDEPYGGRSAKDMEAGHWRTLAETLAAHGVRIDAGELARLPHDVVLSDRLRARLANLG